MAVFWRYISNYEEKDLQCPYDQISSMCWTWINNLCCYPAFFFKTPQKTFLFQAFGSTQCKGCTSLFIYYEFVLIASVITTIVCFYFHLSHHFYSIKTQKIPALSLCAIIAIVTAVLIAFLTVNNLSAHPLLLNWPSEQLLLLRYTDTSIRKTL